MAGEPIVYFDRYAGCRREEEVYGGGALRFAYSTMAGRCLAWLVFARPLVSHIFGWYMRRPASAARVRPFIERYGVDASEFALPLEAFDSFNDFFRRELRDGARPVDPDPRSVVFPADGRHLGWPRLGAEERVFVKGQRWDLAALLGGDSALAERFSGGTLVLSRLCPVDYHHYHFPVAGRVLETRWLGGRLFSVSPIALRRQLAYIWQNKRHLTRIDAGPLGEVCFIEVGATNVGSIRHVPLPPDRVVAKGARKGWFEFGGSAVITLFEPGRVRLSDDLVRSSADGIELYARVGDGMGRY